MKLTARRIALVSTALAVGSLTACNGGGDDGEPLPWRNPSDLRASCASLIAYASSVPNTSVTSTQYVEGGTTRPAGVTTGPFLPGHCIVQGQTNPRTGANNAAFAIGWEVRLPDEWSHRFFFQGGGGNDGAIRPAIGTNTGDLGALAPALTRGFAVASTDGGHTGTAASSYGFDSQARVDHAYNAYDKTAVVAKDLQKVYYGALPDKSYFIGCSGGGRQGMMFSQRFPDYFDGIVAGAPSMRVASGASISATWETQAYTAIAPKDASGNPVLAQAFTDADLQLLGSAILAACDARDGIADSLVNDIQGCTFDPAVLTCSGAKGPTCLTAAQVAALKKGFGGPKNSTGQALYATWPWDFGITGSDWRNWKLGFSTTATPNSRFVTLIQDAMAHEFFTPPDPSFSMYNFNFDTDPARLESYSQIYDSYRDATLAAYKARGSKLILHHGMGDAIFSPTDTIDYYNRLAANNGGLNATKTWARAFLVPGMNHCLGGPTVAGYDGLQAIVDWVEKGVAPDQMVATSNTFPGRTRPVCAYPTQARYVGGNPESASSFACQ